jgi:hypothetical protein
MTLHFNEFDAPAALEDEKPRDLTGDPSLSLATGAIHKKIEAVCPEPGCPNGELPTQTDRPIWQQDLAAPTRPADIYQTQPKDRCVM